MPQITIANKIVAAMQVLGVFEEFKRELQSAVSPNDAAKRVDAFRELAKKRGRELARKHHPDFGGDIEKMKEINAAVTELKGLQMTVTQPRPQPVFVYRPIQTFWTSASTASTTTTGGGFFW